MVLLEQVKGMNFLFFLNKGNLVKLQLSAPESYKLLLDRYVM